MKREKIGKGSIPDSGSRLDGKILGIDNKKNGTERDPIGTVPISNSDLVTYNTSNILKFDFIIYYIVNKENEVDIIYVQLLEQAARTLFQNINFEQKR